MELLERKTPEDIAREIDELYGDDPIGSELHNVLIDKIRKNAYGPEEVKSVRKELLILRDLRLRRAS